MSEYMSMHSFHSEPTDCRMLQIEFHFSRATKSQLKELAKFCIESINSLLDNSFYLEWIWRNRRTTIDHIMQKIDRSEGGCDFSFLGNVATSHINNQKSLGKYQFDLFNHLNHSRDDFEVSLIIIEFTT